MMGFAAAPTDTGASAALDPRLHAFRDGLADKRLARMIHAARYVAGRPAEVVVGRAAVRRAPAPAAAVDTFYHYGEPVLVFAEDGAYAWCQSLDDGYVGYVLRDQLGQGKPPPTHYVATMGSHLYGAPDLRGDAIDFLPRRSAVHVCETGIVTRRTEYARIATGGFLPLACLSPQPPRSDDIVAAAHLYLGCPYLWAGRSFLGLDCSALVQNAFRDIGIFVLRDTDMQQNSIGTAVSADTEGALHRGDLLYIPGHVLIYAGNGEIIHADGASMTVRAEPLALLMRDRDLAFADITVRRWVKAGGPTPG